MHQQHGRHRTAGGREAQHSPCIVGMRMRRPSSLNLASQLMGVEGWLIALGCVVLRPLALSIQCRWPHELSVITDQQISGVRCTTHMTSRDANLPIHDTM
jgi:hypothetical protein